MACVCHVGQLRVCCVESKQDALLNFEIMHAEASWYWSSLIASRPQAACVTVSWPRLLRLNMAAILYVSRQTNESAALDMAPNGAARSDLSAAIELHEEMWCSSHLYRHNRVPRLLILISRHALHPRYICLCKLRGCPGRLMELLYVGESSHVSNHL